MKRIVFVCCLAMTAAEAAEPELKGTVGEVRQHLTTLDRIVSVLEKAR